MQLDKDMLALVFEENYEWFKGFLRRRFVSLNDYDIEDIVQQAAINLLSRADITGVRNITSYIYRTLQNGAKDYYRGHKNEPIEMQDTERSGELTEQEVIAGELKEVIQKAIDSLDEKQRFVFIETQIKGRSYEELVAQTGEKLGTLLSRKSRAVKKLKETIANYIYEEEEK